MQTVMCIWVCLNKFSSIVFFSFSWLIGCLKCLEITHNLGITSVFPLLKVTTVKQLETHLSKIFIKKLPDFSDFVKWPTFFYICAKVDVTARSTLIEVCFITQWLQTTIIGMNTVQNLNCNNYQRICLIEVIIDIWLRHKNIQSSVGWWWWW